jgi:hypothetical protein
VLQVLRVLLLLLALAIALLMAALGQHVCRVVAVLPQHFSVLV